MTNENEKILKLPVKDLAKKMICDGHVFLMVGERKFYLMKPGVYVDPGFIKKHTPNNSIFDFQTVVNQQAKQKFKSLFRELQNLQLEKELRMKCFEIISYFLEVYSAGEHFLSFADACYEEFCSLPQEDQIRMHETDMHLYRKAVYSSAFAIIIGMANDFYHHSMLKDFYHITFSLDAGLCDVHYSYFVAEACNAENQRPGSGIKYLKKQKATDEEIAVYLNHPQKSYDFLKSQSLLAYPELLEVVLYQHELATGGGFPRGIKKGQVSGWEAIVILADSLVEIKSEYEFENNVFDFLLSFHNQKIQDLPVNRVYKKLCSTLEGVRLMKGTGS